MNSRHELWTSVESSQAHRLAARVAHRARMQTDWSVTAGNSSPINDGAAALLIMSRERADQPGLRPLARPHSFAVTRDDPLLMLTAIIPATEKVLRKTGPRHARTRRAVRPADHVRGRRPGQRHHPGGAKAPRPAAAAPALAVCRVTG